MVSGFNDMNTINVLLIEDNLKLAELIKRFAKDKPFRFYHCQFAADLARIPTEERFDVIVCDVMLPDNNGFELFATLRAKFNLPVIFLTALTDISDQIKGLDLGAVDYIVKPVSPEILMAKIKVAARYNQTDTAKPAVSNNEIQLGSLLLKKGSETAHLKGEALPLTHHEFELLWAFATHVNQPLTREELFNQTMNREYNGLDRTIDARIMRLRKKVAELDLPGICIRTVWGKGYVLSFELGTL